MRSVVAILSLLALLASPAAALGGCRGCCVVEVPTRAECPCCARSDTLEEGASCKRVKGVERVEFWLETGPFERVGSLSATVGHRRGD